MLRNLKPKKTEHKKMENKTDNFYNNYYENFNSIQGDSVLQKNYQISIIYLICIHYKSTFVNLTICQVEFTH